MLWLAPRLIRVSALFLGWVTFVLALSSPPLVTEEWSAGDHASLQARCPKLPLLLGTVHRDTLTAKAPAVERTLPTPPLLAGSPAVRPILFATTLLAFTRRGIEPDRPRPRVGIDELRT